MKILKLVAVALFSLIIIGGIFAANVSNITEGVINTTAAEFNNIPNPLCNCEDCNGTCDGNNCTCLLNNTTTGHNEDCLCNKNCNEECSCDGTCHCDGNVFNHNQYRYGYRHGHGQMAGHGHGFQHHGVGCPCHNQ